MHPDNWPKGAVAGTAPTPPWLLSEMANGLSEPEVHEDDLLDHPLDVLWDDDIHNPRPISSSESDF